MLDLHQGILEEFAERTKKDRRFKDAKLTITLGKDRSDYTNDPAAKWLAGDREEVTATIEKRAERLRKKVAARPRLKNKTCDLCGAAFGSRQGKTCSSACSMKLRRQKYYAAHTEKIRARARVKMRNVYKRKT